MHNLNAIVWRQSRRRPVRAAHDSAIDLHRQPFRGQAQRLEELGHTNSLPDFLLFAVYNESHFLLPRVIRQKMGLVKGRLFCGSTAQDLRIRCLSSPRPPFDCASITMAAVPAVKEGRASVKLAIPSRPARPI